MIKPTAIIMVFGVFQNQMFNNLYKEKDDGDKDYKSASSW